MLDAGGAALDAVQAAAVALEDDPLFNAGRGAVLNEDGEVEHDAAVMCGRTGAAGGATVPPPPSQEPTMATNEQGSAKQPTDAAEQPLAINKDTVRDLEAGQGDEEVKGGMAKKTKGCGDYPLTAICTVA